MVSNFNQSNTNKQLRQQRALETRAKLVAACETIIAESGFDAVRVDEVVRRAEVAKGTFFAHFPDKEHLLVNLIGKRLQSELARLWGMPRPKTVQNVVEAHTPAASFKVHDPFVFDLIERHMRVKDPKTADPIATAFYQHTQVLEVSLADSSFRKDISPALLGEGVQIFLMRAIAFDPRSPTTDEAFQNRFTTYLEAWLLPAL